MIRCPLLWISFLILTFISTAIDRIQAQPNATDITVTRIIVPGNQVPAGQALTVEFELSNQGANNSTNFFCGIVIVDQSNPGTPIFQNQIAVPTVAAGATITFQATQPWTPPAPGGYAVRVNATYPPDNNPPNNQLTKNFQVTQPGFLSLAEAIDILNERILDDHPRADSLMALHLSPPANPADSLIPPGLIIDGIDSIETIQYNHPVYFFFIDPFPGQFFSHPCEYVAISAIDGVVDRRPSKMWPLIDGAPADGGVLCDNGNPNNRLIKGDQLPCAAKPNPYTPRTTSNKDDWALVVTGALFRDVEESAVHHDICMFKERINGGEYGPGVTGENITVIQGANNRGVTARELCDAIESFKGKACRKFFFKYIAHGVERDTYGNHDDGIVLWDSTRTKKYFMSWDTLACKLDEAGIRNICIEITSCYSGGIIKALQKKKINGVVTTSSSSKKPTQVGDGSGTPWEKALFECSKDKEADLDKNNSIDFFELVAWVRIKNRSSDPSTSNPLWGDPQIDDLTDSIKDMRIVVDSTSDNDQNMNGTNGGIEVVHKRTAVVITPGQGASRVFTRRWVYLQNKSDRDNVLNKTYQIVAKCKGVDRVLWTGKKKEFSIGAKKRVCVAELPPDCINADGSANVRVEEVKGGTERDRKEDTWTIAGAADSGFVSQIDFPIAHDPGEFILYRHDFIPLDTNGSFTASVLAPPGWEPQLDHPEFKIPDGDTSHPVHTGVFIPDSATVGGILATTVCDVASGEAAEIRYVVHLRDTLPRSFDINDVVNEQWRWYEVLEPTRLHARTVSLDRVRIEVVDSLEVESVGAWNLTNTTIDAHDSAYLKGHIGKGAARTEWRNVAIRGARDGVVADGGLIVMENVTLAASLSDGLHVFGYDVLNDTLVGTSVEQMKNVDVIDAARHGIVFENLRSDTVRAEGLRFFLIDSNDILVRDRTHVECLDCEYREEAASVDASSSLLRYATLSLMALDPAAEGVEGITFTVVDALGRRIFTGVTDTSGIAPDAKVLISRHDQGRFQQLAPLVITARNGTVEQRDTISPTTWTQRIFIFDEGSSAVPTAGERTRHASIVSVIPQPISADEGLIIETTGLGTQTVDVSMHTLLGETIWSSERMNVVNDRLSIRSLGTTITAGVYVLRLHLPEGSILSTKVVVR